MLPLTCRCLSSIIGSSDESPVRVPAVLMIAIALSGCDFVSKVNSEIGFKDEKKPVVDEAPPVTTAQKQDSRNIWWQNATSLGTRSKSGDDPKVQCQVEIGRAHV